MLAEKTETTGKHTNPAVKIDNLGLRPMTEQDIPQVFAWGEAQRGQEYSSEELAGYQDDLRKMLRDDRFRQRIIEENGAAVGWILEDYALRPYDVEVLRVLGEGENDLSVQELVDLSRQTTPEMVWVSINALELKPVTRGQGCGTAVMEHLMAEYQQTGVDVVVFHTDVDNTPMRRLGQKAGFAEVLVPGADAEQSPEQDPGRIFAIKSLGVGKKLALIQDGINQQTKDVRDLEVVRVQLG